METIGVLEHDGLITPEVGEWGEDKYRLIQLYATMFARATRKAWHVRVYIDLFAGSGRARLESSRRVVPGSPLLALDVEPGFERFIFCDLDPEKLNALKKRVVAAHPGREVVYVLGDANVMVPDVLRDVPPGSRRQKVLGFCVLDPFGMSAQHFETVRRLASRYMDFLVLIPSYMEANRFWEDYEKLGNTTVDDYLGLPNWREDWRQPEIRIRGLGPFVVEKFGDQMASLGYGVGRSKLIRARDNNRPLYHLFVYSRHKLGLKLWRQAVKYSDGQQSFDFEELEEWSCPGFVDG
jgi:three-Cys-motif partner protein